MADLQQFTEYLAGLGITNESKRYSLNFCKKMDYIYSIMDKAIERVGGVHMDFGYGDYNSKIVFIFNNRKQFLEIKDKIQKVLEVFSSNYWNVYVTYINKCDKEYTEKINLLMNEVNAVGPELIYMFSNNENDLTLLKNEFTKYNVKKNFTFFHVNTDELLNPTEGTNANMWSKFKYLINYKNVIQDKEGDNDNDGK